MAVTLTLRSRVIVGAVVLAAPALAGCSTSFSAQTDQVYIPARGVNDRSGSVDVLNAVVVSGTDGSGTVSATLVNNEADLDAEADALTGVTVADVQATIDEDEAEIAPMGHNNLGESGAVTVTGADEVEPGNFVTVVFSFAQGKQITVEAPVVPQEGDFEDVPVKAPKTTS